MPLLCPYGVGVLLGHLRWGSSNALVLLWNFLSSSVVFFFFWGGGTIKYRAYIRYGQLSRLMPHEPPPQASPSTRQLLQRQAPLLEIIHSCGRRGQWPAGVFKFMSERSEAWQIWKSTWNMNKWKQRFIAYATCWQWQHLYKWLVCQVLVTIWIIE